MIRILLAFFLVMLLGHPALAVGNGQPVAPEETPEETEQPAKDSDKKEPEKKKPGEKKEEEEEEEPECD